MGSPEDPFKINSPSVPDEKSRKERYAAIKENGYSVDVALEFEPGSKIAEGTFGVIHRVRMDVITEKKERDVGNFIVKKFRRDGEQQAKETLEKYEELKKIGVDTWHTMRLLKDEGALLMTDGEKDGSLVISSNFDSRSVDFFEKSKLDRLEGFEDCVRTAFENLYLANQNNYNITLDAWFASILVQESSSEINKNEQETVGICKQIFIGDLDCVLKCGNSEKDFKFRKGQLFALDQFIDMFVVGEILSVDARRKYWDISDRIFKYWIEANEKQNEKGL